MIQTTMGVVITYNRMFDAAMPAGFREERVASSTSARAVLERLGDCTVAPVVDGPDSVDGAVAALAGRDLDALVVIPSVATPPAWALDVARRLGPVPVIVLAVRELDETPAAYDTEQATRHSALVGASMITNSLLRAGVHFQLVLATAGDETGAAAQLETALAAGRAAAAVRRARLARIGSPIAGYADVEADDGDLDALGISCSDIGAEDLKRWAGEVTPSEIVSTAAAASRLGSTQVGDATLHRASRVACVIARAVRETRSTAGTVNCHGPLVRDNPDLGVTACLALSLLARDGIMLSCTGDLPVALALAMGQAVAGAALYAELYAVDRPGDWILAANGGEGDTRAARHGSVRLLPELHYLGVHGAGVAVAFEYEPGPITLASITPLRGARGGWRLVLADGCVIDSRHQAMEGPNAMIRIDGVPALTAYAAWCDAGASHHAAISPGRWSTELVVAAAYLGIEAVVVSR